MHLNSMEMPLCGEEDRGLKATDNSNGNARQHDLESGLPSAYFLHTKEVGKCDQNIRKLIFCLVFQKSFFRREPTLYEELEI